MGAGSQDAYQIKLYKIKSDIIIKILITKTLVYLVP